MLKPGCKEAYAGTGLRIKSAAPFAIVQGPKVTPGQAEKVCITCSNGYQKVESDEFSVEQTGTCLATLTPNDQPFKAPELKYKTSVVVAKNPVETFIKNSNSEKCPIVGCRLRARGCKADYVGKEVTMDVQTYAISAPGNIPEGFNTNICVECRTKNQAVGYDLITLKQDSVCKTSVSPKSDKMGLNFKYDASKIQLPWGLAFENHFENKYPSLCPAQSCQIMDQGCQAAYSGSRLALKRDSGDWRLIAQTNVQKGYEQTVCFKCQTEGQTVVSDGHQIKQDGMPEDTMVYILIACVGVFLAIIILVLGCFYRNHLDDMKNIKVQRA